MNGCNVDICWQYVKDNLSQVQQEIEDCKGMEGWDEQCQVREAAVVFLCHFEIIKNFGEKGLSLILNRHSMFFVLFMLVDPEGQLWN